jgi:arsenate reductase (glutaredoxin)
MSLPKTDERILFLHNPRCAKSRAALALLEARGAAVEVRRYLDEPLSAAELVDLRKRLARPAIEWVRRGEPEFKASGLGPDSKDKDVLAAIAAHPILLERPIAVRGTRAALGRPPADVLALLDE